MGVDSNSFNSFKGGLTQRCGDAEETGSEINDAFKCRKRDLTLAHHVMDVVRLRRKGRKEYLKFKQRSLTGKD